MMPYDTTINERAYIITGDSLRPLMINYIARHGARFLSSEKKVTALREVFCQAREKGTVTASGESFLQLLNRIELHTAGRWGALNKLGIAEEKELARQMYGLFPELLKKGNVRGVSTYVPRVVMSMYTFCHTLCELSPDLQISTDEGHQYDSLLRFFTTDSTYIAFLDHGSWQRVYKNFIERYVSVWPAKRVIGNFFGNDTARYRSFTMAMYGVLQSLRASELGAAEHEWMTEEEYFHCWQADNLKHCLQRTGTRLSEVPDIAATGLLRSIIASMDMAGKENTAVASLRFGHAETLMPLLSLMHLRNCRFYGTDYSRISSEWKDYEVVPLGANLMIVSLRGPSGRIYCALRLNGRWVSPLSDGRLVVSYPEVRAYWISLTENQQRR